MPEVEGFAEKIGPISGLSGNLVLWLLTAQWTYHMVQRNDTGSGKTVSF
jgi:hypothetical protein